MSDKTVRDGQAVAEGLTGASWSAKKTYGLFRTVPLHAPAATKTAKTVSPTFVTG
jgi:hypothetical protein